MMSSLSKNARESIISLLLKVVAGFLSYVMFIVLAQHLDSEGYGVFGVYFSILMLVSLFSSVGQGTFIIKEVELARVKFHASIGDVYCFSFVLWVVGFCVGCLAWYLYLMLNGDFQVGLFISGSVFLLAYSASHITFGYLRVEDRALVAIFTRDVLWRFLVVVSILTFSNYMSVELVFFVMSGLMLGVVGIHLYLGGTLTFDKSISSVDGQTIKNWFFVSLGMTLVALVSSADGYIFSIFTGLYLDSYSVGIIFSSVRTIELIGVFLMAISMVMSKEYSGCIARNDYQMLQRKCNTTSLIQLPPVILSYFFVVLFSSEILVFFDSSYAEYSGVLVLMATGMLINSVTGSTVMLMQLVGLHWYQVGMQAFAIVISLLCLPYFVEFWGVYGIAYSYIVSKLLWNVPAVLLLKYRGGVDPSIFAIAYNSNGVGKYCISDLFKSRGL